MVWRKVRGRRTREENAAGNERGNLNYQSACLRRERWKDEPGKDV